MRTLTFGLSLAALGSAFLPAAAHAASPTGDVKVCVRIEKKSWTQEGTVPTAPDAARASTKATTPPAPSATGAPLANPARTVPTPADAAPPAAPRKESPPVAPVPQLVTGAEAPILTPADFEAATQVPADAPAALKNMDTSSDPDVFVVNPELYLRRLMEYQVTHEPGFESVRDGCAQTIVVELYPVRHGWTVFARYSGNAREEKVDVVRLDELGTFAERATAALLRDRSIAETLTRTTVLRADSETRVRQIDTHSHLLLGMGSDVRVGMLPTAPNTTDPAVDAFRVETPLSFTVGVRNKFRGWALDATGHMNVGLVQHASRDNLGGGQADYSVGLGLGLGFLAYAEPDAVNTFYYGGGGSFEVSRYQTLGARQKNGDQPSPDGLWGGGLDVDATLGYEFMRTSALHFFVQGTLAIPAYVFQSENDQSRIQAYIPSLNAQVGVLF